MVYLNDTWQNTTNNYAHFMSLSAGNLYTARVFSHSGPFNVSSGMITNATCKYDECVFKGFLTVLCCFVLLCIQSFTASTTHGLGSPIVFFQETTVYSTWILSNTGR